MTATPDDVETPCSCLHAIRWHHETRGCGYHGFSPEHRCPCVATHEQALQAALVRARREGADAALAPVEVTLVEVAGWHRHVIAGEGRHPERIDQCVCLGCVLYRAISAAMAQGRDAAK